MSVPDVKSSIKQRELWQKRKALLVSHMNMIKLHISKFARLEEDITKKYPTFKKAAHAITSELYNILRDMHKNKIIFNYKADDYETQLFDKSEPLQAQQDFTLFTQTKLSDILDVKLYNGTEGRVRCREGSTKEELWRFSGRGSQNYELRGKKFQDLLQNGIKQGFPEDKTIGDLMQSHFYKDFENTSFYSYAFHAFRGEIDFENDIEIHIQSAKLKKKSAKLIEKEEAELLNKLEVYKNLKSKLKSGIASTLPELYDMNSAISHSDKEKRADEIRLFDQILTAVLSASSAGKKIELLDTFKGLLKSCAESDILSLTTIAKHMGKMLTSENGVEEQSMLIGAFKSNMPSDGSMIDKLHALTSLDTLKHAASLSNVPLRKAIKHRDKQIREQKRSKLKRERLEEANFKKIIKITMDYDKFLQKFKQLVIDKSEPQREGEEQEVKFSGTKSTLSDIYLKELGRVDYKSTTKLASPALTQLDNLKRAIHQVMKCSRDSDLSKKSKSHIKFKSERALKLACSLESELTDNIMASKQKKKSKRFSFLARTLRKKS